MERKVETSTRKLLAAEIACYQAESRALGSPYCRLREGGGGGGAVIGEGYSVGGNLIW